MLTAERKWLIIASLGATALTFLFFILAPAFGYPLTYEDAFGVVQIIVPVFTGYLGTAAQFAFANPGNADPAMNANVKPLVRLMVRGPVFVFLFIIVAVVIAFGVTNGEDAAPGSGMSVGLLSTVTTAGLALLAVTTNAAVAYLFVAQGAANVPNPNPAN